MSGSQGPVKDKLRQATRLIKAGQKKDARQLLREVLAADANNLAAWELLVYASYNPEEEAYCLKHILNLKPTHPWARQRLDALSQVEATAEAPFPGQAEAAGPWPSQQPSSKAHTKWWEERRIWIPISLGVLAVLCVGAALIGSGILLRSSSAANQQADCQALIQKAMQASGNYCNRVGPEQVCYGNITLQAELLPNTLQRFSERGDILDVGYLRRLSASPLDLNKDQWGIAIFKVLANLPNSLPGQLVTLLVFGNTSLSKDTPSLESFYFSSEFGQMICEKAPYDGIMVNVPDGSGVHFTVNGADLTLLGDASLQAAKNGDMRVNLYNGSGLVVANGEKQYIGGGQTVSVKLGGSNGLESVGPPSTPAPLSGDDLNVSCAVNGENCSEATIPTVNQETAQAKVEASLITSTPSKSPTNSPTATDTRTATRTLTATRSLTATRTPTSTVTLTPTRTSTPTRTPSRTSTPTRTSTRTSTRTATRTSTHTATRTSTRTSTPSSTRTPTWTYTASFTPTASLTHTNTFTPTRTDTATPSFTPSDTPTSSLTPTPSNTSTLTPTPTDTPTLTPSDTPTSTSTDTSTPTPTETPTTAPTITPGTVCANITLGSLTVDGTALNQLDTSITNNSGSVVKITDMEVQWVKSPTSQKLWYVIFNNNTIWSGTSNFPPTQIGSADWSGTDNDRQIPSDSTPYPLYIQFKDDVTSTGNKVTITFDTSTCQAQASN